jgi:hypothetical protein
MTRLPSPTFDNPRLKVIWAGIATLQPDEALELALVLHKLLGRGSFPSTRAKDRTMDVIACLRQVAEKLDRSPSVREYEEYRAAHPELQLVASGSIRTRLAGGWNDCLKRAQLGAVLDGDLPLTKRSNFTEEEMIQALLECHKDLGQIPTLFTYREWAMRPDVIAREGNRPQTYAPMVRAFGGFPRALRAAGIVGEAIRRHGRVDPTEWSYEETELLDALRLVAGRLGYSPSVKEYGEERQKLMAEQREAGEPTQPLPAASSIMRRFSTWGASFDAADLPPRRTRKGAKPGPKQPRYSDENILDSLREAYLGQGEPFTHESYDAWRHNRLQFDPTKGIASAGTAVKRFRSWGDAVERAFAEQKKAASDATAA